MDLAVQAILVGLASVALLQSDEIVLADHHVLEGTVVSSTSDSVTFAHDASGTDCRLAARECRPPGPGPARRAKELHGVGEDDLAHVNRILDRAAADVAKGLKENELGEGLKDFQHAQAEYERGLHDIGRMRKKYAADAALTKTLGGEVEQLNEDLINVHLKIGSVHFHERVTSRLHWIRD